MGGGNQRKPTVTDTIICSALDQHETAAINYLTDCIPKIGKEKDVNIIKKILINNEHKKINIAVTKKEE
jgi:hypothetical protein